LRNPSRMKSTAILEDSFAFGCGAKITAFLPFKIVTALLAGVAVGLVTGVSAPMTPTGFAYFLIFFSSSTSIKPTDLAPLTSFKIPKTLFLCLMILSATLPIPVSSTAFSANNLMFSSL